MKASSWWIFITKQTENPNHDGYVNAQFSSSTNSKGKNWWDCCSSWSIWKIQAHTPWRQISCSCLNCLNNLPSLQTYDVESTSVLTDKSVVSATSVFVNERTPTNTTPIPSFVRNNEQDKDQGPGLVGGICTDCQVMNSEHLCIDCNKFVCSICCDGFRNLQNIWCCGACFSMHSSDVQELIRQHKYSWIYFTKNKYSYIIYIKLSC